MTQSMPAKPKAAPNEGTRHQRLMELIEAEDAAKGEVGCGRDLGTEFQALSAPLKLRLRMKN